ncbi:uncharacterized protein LOC131670559 [Phymastichus coffea]|uniref:uncharacterized protein LOC131670559 n=1 Tax=Phymastichus coffea TaxID=108790 RepID=UPI00273CA91B|nr:uncharacterized protein LOC131670559 [Phymastichus coffea]
MFNKILQPIARRAALNLRGNQHRLCHHENHFKYVTFEEATVPQGSWKENYEKMQKKYTMQLVGGIGSLVATIAIVLQFELIYFNYGPPKPKNV